MPSEMIAMLMPPGSSGAALLVRRGDGQFAFERIDARVARAAGVAARMLHKRMYHTDVRESDPAASTMRGLDKI